MIVDMSVSEFIAVGGGQAGQDLNFGTTSSQKGCFNITICPPISASTAEDSRVNVERIIPCPTCKPIYMGCLASCNAATDGAAFALCVAGCTGALEYCRKNCW